MVKDDHDRNAQAAGTPGLSFRPRGWIFVVAVLALTAVSVIVATGCFKARLPLNPDPGPDPAEGQVEPESFQGWNKPDLALVVSGQMFGYLQPCGCSRPQLGGLARRYNFIHGQLIKERGWPVVSVDVGDVGDVLPRRGPQSLLKYVTAMKGLQLLRYPAIGVGQNEMALPLIVGLAEFTSDPQNTSPRVLAANLIEKDKTFLGMIKSWEIVGGKNGVPRVGVVGVVEESVAKLAQDADVRFDPVEKVLPGVLQELKAQKPDLLVLLLQGSIDEAKACARKFPQFHVIGCISEFDEPSSKPEAEVGNTLILALGHKGRYVGVLGAYRTNRPNQPFQMRYQLVAMSEAYETPEGKEAGNPIHALLQDYADELKKNNYLARYQPTRHSVQVKYSPEATYVGSDKCKSCHKGAYQVWERKTDTGKSHSIAYTSLTEAKRPTLRQYDGECVVCHVVGFGIQGGFRNEAQTPFLKNVGCESCHGPGSLHIQQARAGSPDAKLLALMNPYKVPPNESAAAKTQRINRLDQSCQKCHDTDNDVHWTIDKWKLIEHREP
jgi:hypothetical protein